MRAVAVGQRPLGDQNRFPIFYPLDLAIEDVEDWRINQIVGEVGREQRRLNFFRLRAARKKVAINTRRNCRLGMSCSLSLE